MLRDRVVDSDQIKTLIEINIIPRWERADILKMSKSIKLLVKMKNVKTNRKEKMKNVSFIS